MPTTPLTHLPAGTVKLLPGLFQQRLELNRAYLLSLTTPNLLQNHYLEAGLWSPRQRSEDIHMGWEAPTCQVRGHFLGHWLSAAAYLSANTGDAEIRGKADTIVSELARCQAILTDRSAALLARWAGPAASEPAAPWLLGPAKACPS